MRLKPCLRNCGKLVCLEGKDSSGRWIVTNFEGGPKHVCRGKRGVKRDKLRNIMNNNKEKGLDLYQRIPDFSKEDRLNCQNKIETTQL
jgi:hypothetical protein